jgi:hypothetical protein
MTHSRLTAHGGSHFLNFVSARAFYFDRPNNQSIGGADRPCSLPVPVLVEGAPRGEQTLNVSK